MRGRRVSTLLMTALATLMAGTLMAATRAAAQQEKVLHSFGSSSKLGAYPLGPLTLDTAGNLYGSTGLGGTYNGGTVFELKPAAGGGWTVKILHEFGNTGDGQNPYWTLILDTAGNLYGVTSSGGVNNAGTAFELSPQTGGSWKETILHNFNFNGTDGYDPSGGVVFDGAGNLYGTTNGGGANNTGIVFELSPSEGGSWAETILHSFGNNSTTDGQEPYLVQLVLDASGNLYGTTEYGGAYQNGTVFELSPAAGGGWTESVLHSFNPGTTDGLSPSSGLIIDASGNLYGTAYFGGANNAGSVFEVSPAGSGRWTEKTIYNFKQNGIDGQNPAASLVVDAVSNLYGTTNDGGSCGFGTAFVLTHKPGGSWTEEQLHSFCDNGADGYYPFTPLTFNAAGILYGTTNSGGANAEGSIFVIKP
jgi:uncharacterized repeat protein (TIGR03803 family)